MRMNDFDNSPTAVHLSLSFEQAASASPALLSAAVAGLLALGGCSDDADFMAVEDLTPPEGLMSDAGLVAMDAGAPPPGFAQPDAAAANEPVVLSEYRDETMTYAKLAEMCKNRGGYLQTHAACFGNNSCKGFSYHKYKIIEHTCKAVNTCSGASCVVSPPDKGLTGEAVYNASCGAGGCHKAKEFVFYVPPGTDLVRAKNEFLNKSALEQELIVAFGTVGVNRGPGGAVSVFANMPAQHEKYSRAEIERVVAYLRTLPPTPKEYQILGVTSDILPPDAGMAPAPAPHE